MVDWSESEKEKIWEAACGPNGTECDLTFEQFKALIQGEGGFNLVQRMATGAGAAHIERGSQAPLERFVHLDETLRQRSTSDVQDVGSITKDPSVQAAPSLPHTLSKSGVRGSGSRDDSDTDLAESSSSDGGDGTGRIKPALLTKRSGALSPELVRGANCGAILKSPSRTAADFMRRYDEPKAPLGLPKAKSESICDSHQPARDVTHSSSSPILKHQPTASGQSSARVRICILNVVKTRSNAISCLNQLSSYALISQLFCSQLF
jgi:hypothetical protein